jgi:2'-5' RNA ligase
MTELAIVAYPSLDDADRSWIESIRAQHDPQASRIEAHFTLVFPVDVSPGPVAAHTSLVVKLARPISFAVRHARAVGNAVGGGGQVFLVADEGYDEIVKLHDRLYEGLLRPYLRKDVPFVPHLTVAANPDFPWCEGFAEDVNVAQRIVRGALRSIELVDVGTTRVRSVMTFRFGGLKSIHLE